jgi:hypothetical protein
MQLAEHLHDSDRFNVPYFIGTPIPCRGSSGRENAAQFSISTSISNLAASLVGLCGPPMSVRFPTSTDTAVNCRIMIGIIEPDNADEL